MFAVCANFMELFIDSYHELQAVRRKRGRGRVTQSASRLCQSSVAILGCIVLTCGIGRIHTLRSLVVLFDTVSLLLCHS